MNQSAAPALSIYLEETFIPAVLQDRKPGTCNEYRKACRRFICWTGLDIRLHDVDELLVERFRRAMIVEGLAFRTACQWATLVRRVVRHGSPGHCLKGIGRRPHEDQPTVIRGMSDDELLAPQRSLLKFAMDTYVTKKMIGCRQISVNHLRWSINRFAKYLGRAPILDDCCNSTMTSFMAWMLNVRKHSPATVNGTRKNIVSLWNYANRRGLIREQPNDCEKLKLPKDLPAAWTLEEVGRILAAAKEMTSPKIGMVYPAYVFWPALLLVAYDTGLRVRSLMGIRRSDWNSDRREVSVTAEFSKVSVAQTFVVSQQTSEAIHRMLAETNLKMNDDELPEFLFHWPKRFDAVHEHFRAILKRAGLYVKGMDTWHKMRKSTATHLTAAIGIDAASRQLCHSSVQMTKRYVDPRLVGHHDAASHLPRPK